MFTTNLESHSYLLYSSSHPSHVKNSIPFSQFLRLHRSCSDDFDFSEAMCQFFDKRGYAIPVVQAGHHRAQQWSTVSSHYKRLRGEIPIAFHSLSHFTLTTTQLNTSFSKNFEVLQNNSDWYYLFATSTSLIQTWQKHRQLFGQKFISNQ